MQARGRAGVRQGVRDALRDALRLTCGLEAPWNTSNASTGASQHRGVSSRVTFRPLREEKEAPGLRWRQRGRREPPSLCAERTLGGWEAETGPPLTSVGLSVSCNRKWARRWRLKIQSCTPPPYAKRCVTVPTLAKTAPVSMNKSTLKALVVFPVCGSSTSRCRSAGKRVAVGSCSQRERESRTCFYRCPPRVSLDLRPSWTLRGLMSVVQARGSGRAARALARGALFFCWEDFCSKPELRGGNFGCVQLFVAPLLCR